MVEGLITQTDHYKIGVKLPFLYFVFPTWFTKKYFVAGQNVFELAELVNIRPDLYGSLPLTYG